MTFISYAQNFEDVMLWRALKHIEHGFYVDVGANDPVEDSITKAFYDRGWCGINVEPLSTHIQALNDQRPRDINLQCIVSNQPGHIELWESEVRGWASAHPDVIKAHIDAGHQGRYITVPSASLASICEHYKPQDIHFLKIDVEGLESAVLLSNNWHQFRPWIVVVEATLPASQIENHAEWENLLTDNGYEFTYADGLNRFYVAQEHGDLHAAFKYPPNVFDGFVKSHEHKQSEEISSLNQQLIFYKNKQPSAYPDIVKAQATIIDLQAQLIELQKQHQQIEQDTANRLTEAYIQSHEAQKQMLALQNKLHHLGDELTQTKLELKTEKTRASTSAQQLHDLNQNCHHWHTEANAAQQQVSHLINSKSWRISAPLRGMGLVARQIKQGVKNTLKPPLKAAMAFVLNNQTIREKALYWLEKTPSFKAKLRRFGIHQGLIILSIPDLIKNNAENNEFTITQFEQLAPRAKDIFTQLKSQTQIH